MKSSFDSACHVLFQGLTRGSEHVWWNLLFWKSDFQYFILCIFNVMKSSLRNHLIASFFVPAFGLFTGSRPDPRCVRAPLATCALALGASRSRPGLRALPRLRESADPRLLQKRPGPAAGSPPRPPPHPPVPGRCWCSWICKEFACLQIPSVSPLWGLPNFLILSWLGPT